MKWFDHNHPSLVLINIKFDQPIFQNRNSCDAWGFPLSGYTTTKVRQMHLRLRKLTTLVYLYWRLWKSTPHYGPTGLLPKSTHPKQISQFILTTGWNPRVASEVGECRSLEWRTRINSGTWLREGGHSRNLCPGGNSFFGPHWNAFAANRGADLIPSESTSL